MIPNAPNGSICQMPSVRSHERLIFLDMASLRICNHKSEFCTHDQYLWVMHILYLHVPTTVPRRSEEQKMSWKIPLKFRSANIQRKDTYILRRIPRMVSHVLIPIGQNKQLLDMLWRSQRIAAVALPPADDFGFSVSLTIRGIDMDHPSPHIEPLLREVGDAKGKGVSQCWTAAPLRSPARSPKWCANLKDPWWMTPECYKENEWDVNHICSWWMKIIMAYYGYTMLKHMLYYMLYSML